MHASPYHVYPASNSFYPAQTAFQNPPSGVPSVQSNNSSPQFNLKRQQIVSVLIGADLFLRESSQDKCQFFFRRCHQSSVPLHILLAARTAVSHPEKACKKPRSRVNYRKQTPRQLSPKSTRCFQQCQRPTFGCF